MAVEPLSVSHRFLPKTAVVLEMIVVVHGSSNPVPPLVRVGSAGLAGVATNSRNHHHHHHHPLHLWWWLFLVGFRVPA